jgi:spore maturation protein CgeB
VDDFEQLGLKGVQGFHRSAQHTWIRDEPQAGSHYVYWRDTSQLYETIDYYLKPENKHELYTIAENGRKWAQSHTYIERVKKILADLQFVY